MLRFANITLSNPAKSKIAAIDVQAIVTDEDFALTIGEGLAKRLQLPASSSASAATRMNDRQSIEKPVLGPVRIICNGKEISVNAVQCGSGAVIGRHLAAQLRADTGMVAPEQENVGSPEKILIREQVIDADMCRTICEYAARKKAARSDVTRVVRSVMPGADRYPSEKDHQRDAYSIRTKGVHRLLENIFFDIFSKHIEPFFGIEIEWWERPQLLSYEKGGKYDPHVDGEKWVKNPGEKPYWQRHMNRDISVVLYLNDAFTGGKLNFPKQKFKLQPKPGLLVAFPSTAAYIHGAEPTESGDRLVVVTWAAAVGTTRVTKTGRKTLMEPLRNAAKQQA